MTAASALAVAVQARFSAQVLVELTNPRNPGATAINSTTLTAGCADAIVRFEAETGVAFNSAAAAHLAAGCDVCAFYLHARAGNSVEAERCWVLAKPLLEALRRGTAITARTPSALAISDAERVITLDFTPRKLRDFRAADVDETGDPDAHDGNGAD